MAIIPKNYKRPLQFRSKTRTPKIKSYEFRLKRLLKKKPLSRATVQEPLQEQRLNDSHPTEGLYSVTSMINKQRLFQKKPTVSGLPTNKLLFGQYGICFDQSGAVGSKFVDTIRLDLAKQLRKRGRVWLRICCDTPVSARPVETRMGKGKGSVSYWAARVSPGQLFFEFSGITLGQLVAIHRSLRSKSPIGLRMVY
jgi:large subunit ribosomal protein L16